MSDINSLMAIIVSTLISVRCDNAGQRIEEIQKSMSSYEVKEGVVKRTEVSCRCSEIHGLTLPCRSMCKEVK